MASTADQNTTITNGAASWIPEGYVAIMGPDQQRYVVPDFCVPALHQTLDGYRKKDALQVFKATGSVSTNDLLDLTRGGRHADH